MEYVLLIYADPHQPDSPELFAKYDRFTEEVAAKGVLLGGKRLHRSPAERTVSIRDGKTITTDGPYAETKEQIGGFYILDCASIDQAVEFAAQIPNAADGFIEVRPSHNGS